MTELVEELEQLKSLVAQKEAAVEKWQKEAQAARQITSHAAEVILSPCPSSFSAAAAAASSFSSSRLSPPTFAAAAAAAASPIWSAGPGAASSAVFVLLTVASADPRVDASG